jgi:hypothetical protein
MRPYENSLGLPKAASSFANRRILGRRLLQVREGQPKNKFWGTIFCICLIGLLLKVLPGSIRLLSEMVI